MWKKGVQQGKGKCDWGESEREWSGPFVSGKAHGKGKLAMEDGSVKACEYKQGRAEVDENEEKNVKDTHQKIKN